MCELHEEDAADGGSRRFASCRELAARLRLGRRVDAQRQDSVATTTTARPRASWSTSGIREGLCRVSWTELNSKLSKPGAEGGSGGDGGGNGGGGGDGEGGGGEAGR